MRRPVPLLTLFVLATLAHGIARADERPTVAVVGINFRGNIPDAAREILVQRLREGLAAANLDVRPGAAPRAPICQEPTCWIALARASGARFLVTGEIVEHQKTYDINLRLLAGSSGNEFGSTRQRCDICGLEEVGEKMALAVSGLSTRLSSLVQSPARLIVRSTPARAAVSVDNRLIGLAPVELTLVQGPHKIVVEAHGHVPLERTVTTTSGVDETLDLTLLREASSFPYKALGWASLVGGAALIAAGLWTINLPVEQEPCADSAKDPAGNCPYLRRTDVLGAAAMGVGAAAATLGGVWLYLGRDQNAATPEAHASTGMRFSAGYRATF